MASRTHVYDIEQIMYSFMRYRDDRFFDKDSAREQFEKHFNPALAKQVFDDVFNRKEIQTKLKDNRELLKREGRLPKREYTNQELKEVKKIRKWVYAEIKGRKVRARAVEIKIKGKKVTRYRDSFGRFTSNPDKS